MADDKTPAESIRAFVEEFGGRLHVGCPGTIVSYDAARQTCSVRPVSHVRVDTDEIAMPVIDDVPVMWPRGSGWVVSGPLAAGDAVWLAFADRELDGWRGAGAAVSPSSPRAHHPSDAVALPMGVWPDASPDSRVSTTDVVVAGPGGSQISIKPNGSVVITSAGSTHIGGEGAALALAAAVDAQMTALRTALLAYAVPPIGVAVPATDPAGLVFQTAVTALLASGWPTTTAAAKAKGV